MKHVRIVIDEVTWYDGIPEELNVSQTDDTLLLKIGPKPQRRGGGSLGDLLGGARRQPLTEPRRVPEPPPMSPMVDEQLP